MRITSEFANKFKQILEAQEGEVCSYSGRAMYGIKCLAIAIEKDSNIFELVSLITIDYEEQYPNDFSQLANAFRTAKTDSLGRRIILYFPSIEWIWDDENEEDDEE